MDPKTLRQDAGLTQAECARLAGVSVRTVRRWEKNPERVPFMVTRWLALEAGRLPGAPAGFKRQRDGIRTPGGDLIPWGMVEQARYLVALLSDTEREAAGASAADPQDQPRRAGQKVRSLNQATGSRSRRSGPG